MELSFDALFQALFDSPVPRIVVQADAPNFTIVTNNEAHKVATNLVGVDITGKTIPEVFYPENAGEGGELLIKALTDAQLLKRTILMPPFRYDMPAEGKGDLEVKWWQLEIVPLGGSATAPEYLMITTYNITADIISKQEIEGARIKEQLLNEELATTNEELAATNEELTSLNESLDEEVILRTKELTISESKFRKLVEQAPIAIALLKGKDHVVDAINPEMLKLWDKNESVIGKPILEALPEMIGQPYPLILDQVLRSGETYYGDEAEVILVRENKPETGYFNFINQPITTVEGKTEGIIVVANEVTTQVLARRKIEQSEQKLHTLVLTARNALMILRGPDWVVEIANQGIANLWNKSLNEITGRRLLDILPELEGQPFPALLEQVYTTGVSYGQEEEVFYLQTPEGTVTKYTSFYYDPIIEDGKVSGIIVTANEITDAVNARKELERAYEQIRLSKEAAELGLFDLDLYKGTMVWDTRCRELFGVSHQDEVSYENDFLPNLHEDDRDRLASLISDLLANKGNDGHYDAEYRTIGVEDAKLRWVRAKGRVFYDGRGIPTRFTGSVLDITDGKMEEQRKNDFIGMVSHELKTPLTSLKANVQMLQVRSRNSIDEVTNRALAQADKQVKRMTGMINGFLTMSKLEAGSLHLNKTELDINRLIGQVIEDIQLTVQTHHFSFNPQQKVMVTADEDKLSHVVYSLISNALKYSPHGTTVYAETRNTNDGIRVIIKDQGIGIKENDLKQLFGKYYRVDEMNTQFISGFGISLYLCSEIIKLHKGRIWVESTIGEGASFIFELPGDN